MKRIKPTQRRALCVAAIAGMAVALAACHGHDDDDDRDTGSSPPPVAGTPNPPPAATDAFITTVTQLVGAQDDTGDPVTTDSVTATMPEDAEPQPVAGS